MKISLSKEYDNKAHQPIAHTTSPIVTGASVVALKFRDGVIIGTDTLCSYGSMADFKDVKRIRQISKNTVIAASGDHSDFQEVVRLLGEINTEALQYDDGVSPTPRDYANFLARVQYQRRNKIDPLYLMNVIAGYYNGEQYLGLVDLYGTYIEAKTITTGFANYFCKAIISNYWREDFSEEEARKILIECFKVVFCRDARAHDRIQISVINKDGVRIEDPIQVETRWDFQKFASKANEKLHTQ